MLKKKHSLAHWKIIIICMVFYEWKEKKKTQHFYNNKVRHPYSLISEWLSIGNPQGTPLGCSVSRVCMCNLQKTFDCQFLILLMLKFLTTDLYPFFFFYILYLLCMFTYAYSSLFPLPELLY